MEANRSDVITLGKPVVYLGTNNGTEWCRGGLGFKSYVSFSYLYKGAAMFLNEGSGPTLWIHKSGMKISVEYDPFATDKDLSDVIADAIAQEAMKIVAQSEIVISDAHDQSLGYTFLRRLKVTHNGTCKGWDFNKAVVHRQFFSEMVVA